MEIVTITTYFPPSPSTPHVSNHPKRKPSTDSTLRSPPLPPLVLLTSHGVIGFNDAQDLQHLLARFHLCRCSNSLASTHLIVTRSISPLHHISHHPSHSPRGLGPFNTVPLLKSIATFVLPHHAETSLHTRDNCPGTLLSVTVSIYKLFKALPYCPSFKSTRCDPKRLSAILSSSLLGK